MYRVYHRLANEKTATVKNEKPREDSKRIKRYMK